MVRLVGDSQSFKAMLADAQKQSQETAQSVQNAAARIEGITKSVEGFGKSLLSVFGAIGIATSLKGAFEAFTEMERGQRRLAAAIEAGGNPVRQTTAEYLKFAKTISETTLTTKGATLGMLAQAEQMGKTGPVAEKMVKDSIAFAAAKGGEAQEWLRAAYAMQQGNVHMLRFQLGLRGAKSDAEVMAMAQRLLASGTRIAQEEVNTAAGRLEKLGRTFGGVKREMGGMVADGLQPVIGGLEAAASWFNSLDPAIRRSMTAAIAMTAATVAAGKALTSLKDSNILSGLGGKVGLVGAALYGAYEGSSWIYRQHDSVKQLKTETEAAEQQLSKLIETATRRNTAEAGSLSSERDPATRAQLTRKAYEDANTAVSDLAHNLENSQRQLAGSTGESKGLLGYIQDGPRRESLKNDIKTQTALLQTAKERAAGLLGELKKANDAVPPVLQVVDAMRELERLEYTPKQRGMTKELVHNVYDLEQALQKEIATFGMDEDAKKRWELANKGASDAVLRSVDLLTARKQAMSEDKKLTEQAAQLRKQLGSSAEDGGKEEEYAILLQQGKIAAQEYAMALLKLVDTKKSMTQATVEYSAAGSAANRIQQQQAMDALREAQAVGALARANGQQAQQSAPMYPRANVPGLSYGAGVAGVPGNAPAIPWSPELMRSAVKQGMEDSRTLSVTIAGF